MLPKNSAEGVDGLNNNKLDFCFFLAGSLAGLRHHVFFVKGLFIQKARQFPMLYPESAP